MSGNTYDLSFYDLDGETKNVLEEDWDYLIILDACRFDFFKDLYRNYSSGDLKKAISPATITMMWLNRVFKDYYGDIVYVSANPYINSKVEVTDQYVLIHVEKPSSENMTFGYKISVLKVIA